MIETCNCCATIYLYVLSSRNIFYVNILNINILLKTASFFLKSVKKEIMLLIIISYIGKAWSYILTVLSNPKRCLHLCCHLVLFTPFLKSISAFFINVNPALWQSHISTITYSSLHVKPDGVCHADSGDAEQEYDEFDGVLVELESEWLREQNAPDELALRCVETRPDHFC